jgi:circadian clock protein KaiC
MQNYLTRIESGVPGLDTILCGGFVRGSAYILQGRPGAGKTILANQLAYMHARKGQSVLYVTMLAEAHDRLFQSLSTLDFYDPAFLGERINYISFFQTLRDEGLGAVVRMLREELSRRQPAMLVIDGLLSARDRADSDLDVKSFVAELQGPAAIASCTMFFLTSAGIAETSPEHTMVDGVIELKEETAGLRSTRWLQVLKSRGSSALGGVHQLEISGTGIAIYPRIEALYAHPSLDESPTRRRLPSGVHGLDGLIGGGVPEASVSLLLGPSGSGKTTFGLSYLAESTVESPGLHFGFYESPARLISRAASTGIDLPALMNAGALRLIWNPMTEMLVDKLGHQLLDTVVKFGVKRVFVDGFGGFERATLGRPRLVPFLAALTNELRARGATVVATWELRDLFGSQVSDPVPEFSSLLDNLILVRQTEWQSELKRLLAVVKMRDSEFDPKLHGLEISNAGLKVIAAPHGASGLVSGVAQATPSGQS